MKKTIAAALILLLMFVGSLYNIHYLDNLTGEITAHIQHSRQLCEAGSFDEAQSSLQKALDIWLNAHRYTHVFIRHSEIDAVTDAFYDVLQELGHDEADTAAGSYDMLLYHLNSIADMERIRLESIL